MRTNRTALASFCLSMVLAGCPANQPRLPDPHIEDSFTVGSPFSGAHHGHITLQRHALGKAFMILPTVIRGSRIPKPHLMAPRVVSFELQGNKLAMLERNLQAVYSELPSVELLQTFEVTDQTHETITFNWNMGLESVPQESGRTFSDENATLQEPKQPPLRIRSSFLRSARIVENGLELEQVSRLEPTTGKGPSDDDAVTVRARIIPYEMNPGFAPRHSTLQRGVGYFEVAHHVPGLPRPELLAVRWDAQAKPVTYLISSHTPAHLVQAVAEGVLYWNRVAGRELVRVETNVDPNGPIGDHQVIIHWVNWLDADAAYGEMQADPVTGEALHGHIFFPSAFTQLGPEALDQLGHGAAHSRAHNDVNAQGFASGKLCNHPPMALSHAFATQLRRAPGAAERASADGLRSIVAHEVGHTLGLRHNFAASGATALADTDSVHAELAAYVTQANHLGTAVASSVMDYLTSEEEVLQGAAIRHQALPYDVAALQWGYSPVPVQVSSLSVPTFCTDAESQERVLGCAPYDSGARPIAAITHGLKLERKQLGERLAHQALGRSEAHENGGLPSVFSPSWAKSQISLFAHLAKGASALEVRLAMGPQQRLLDPRGYEAANGQALGAAAEEVGGLPGILAAAYPMDADYRPRTGWLLIDFVHALEQAGLPRSQVEASKHASAQAADAYEQMVLGIALQALTGGFYRDHAAPPLPSFMGSAGPTPFADGVVKPSWEPALTALGRHVLLDTKSLGDLPQPRHAHATRMAAVQLFSAQLFGRIDWAQAQRAALIAELSQRRETEALRPVMGTATKSAAERTEWLRQELEVIGALSTLNTP